ncbi:MAG: ADP-ribosyltransferase [Bdellovibrionia bacterium]
MKVLSNFTNAFFAVLLFVLFAPIARSEGADKSIADNEANNAIRRYTGSEFIPMNKALRTGQDITPEIKRKIEAMDHGLNKLPQYQGDTEGTHLKRITELPDDMAKKGRGEIIHDPAYMSTSKASLESSVAPGRHKLIILGKKGKPFCGAKDVSHLACVPGEKEVILPRGTSMKVIGKWKIPNKYGGPQKDIIFLKKPGLADVVHEATQKSKK